MLAAVFPGFVVLQIVAYSTLWFGMLTSMSNNVPNPKICLIKMSHFMVFLTPKLPTTKGLWAKKPASQGG